MVWQKLGCIYEPRPICETLQTHAANPLAVQLGRDLYRIYFSGRNHDNKSSVGYFDFDIVKMACVGICEKAVFTFGPKCRFYSHGVSVGCSQRIGADTYLTFMGWHIPANGHWRGEIGRFRIDDEGNGILDPEQPLLGLNEQDPISLSYPWIFSDSDKGLRMIYGATLSWDSENGEMVHILRQAVSEDGENWTRLDDDLPWAINEAQAFSRPTVMTDDDGKLRMWFSYRSGTGESYRIGYAEKPNGQQWQLKLSESGIDVSEDGWDCDMIEYPFVFQHSDQTYMLYNGNGFGASGIGLARLKP